MYADSKPARQPVRSWARRRSSGAMAALSAIALVAAAAVPPARAAEGDKPGKATAMPVPAARPVAQAAPGEPEAPAAGAPKAKPPTTRPIGAKPPTTRPIKVSPIAPKPKPAPRDDGPSYKIGRFELSYGREHPDHPPIDPFLRIPIVLGKTAHGFVAPGKGVASQTVRLADFQGEKVEVFFASAIRRINGEIVAAFHRQGIVGVFVAPHKEDMNVRTGKDLRKAGNTTLRLVVSSAVVSEVRTLGGGQRVAVEDRINHPVHARVRRHSPVVPGGLLNKAKLDDYLSLLNRHPGRRVDAAVSAGKKTGEVAVDYLVQENRPWLAYAQTSNTGTEATNKWRHRFGFIHNQFTGNDDILSIDYTTSCFDEPEAQSFSGSYEAPFLDMDRLRWRLFGSWAKFEAEVDSGLGFGENFTGHEWRFGGEMIAYAFQRRQTFLDLLAGAYWWHVLVKNELLQQTGDADLFVPYVGMRLERITEVATTLGSVTLEWNCPGIAGSDEDDLELLGRTLPDRDFVLLRWDVLQSFFLEPLLDPEGWRDVATPGSSTLAHELAFQFRGQCAMNQYRMIPQNERVVGGFFTVRGYPESSVAGDSAVIATAEYRLHIPRLLKPLSLRSDEEQKAVPGTLPLVGTPFRWVPQTVFGRPDWDLIFRAFVDVGRTRMVDAQPFEEDSTLVGAGVGLELQFTRHFNVRCDMGIPCRRLETDAQTVDPGDARLHFVATVLW